MGFRSSVSRSLFCIRGLHVEARLDNTTLSEICDGKYVALVVVCAGPDLYAAAWVMVWVIPC